MNKYTLQFNNAFLQTQFEHNRICYIRIMMKHVGIALVWYQLINIIQYFINSVYTPKPYIYTGILIISQSFSILIAVFRSQWANAYQTLNSFILVSSFVWSYLDKDLMGDLKLVGMHPYFAGLVHGIVFYLSNINHNYIVKCVMAAYTFIFFLAVDNENIFTNFIKVFPVLLIYIYKIYRKRRSTIEKFLNQKQQEAWNHLLNKTFPISVAMCKLNQMEPYIELSKTNEKAEKDLKIKSSEDLLNFIKTTFLDKFDPGQQKKPSQIPLTWDNSIYGIIRTRFNSISQYSQKDFSNESQKIYKIKGAMQNLQRASVQSQLGPLQPIKNLSIFQQQQQQQIVNSPSNLQDQLRKGNENNYVNISNCQINQLNDLNWKTDTFLGIKKNQDDSESRYSVKLAFFHTDQPYAMIMMENENMNQRYSTLEKTHQYLDKLFIQSNIYMQKITHRIYDEIKKLLLVEQLRQYRIQLYSPLSISYFGKNTVYNYLEAYQMVTKRLKKLPCIAPFSLNDEIEGIKIIFSPFFQLKNLKFLVSNKLNFDEINNDQRQFKQLMTNIIHNACEYAQKDSVLAMKITLDNKSQGAVKIRIRNNITPDTQINKEILDLLNYKTMFSADDMLNLYFMQNKFPFGILISQKILSQMGPYDKIDYKIRSNVYFQVAFSVYYNLEILHQRSSFSYNWRRGSQWSDHVLDESEESFDEWINQQQMNNYFQKTSKHSEIKNQEIIIQVPNNSFQN